MFDELLVDMPHVTVRRSYLTCNTCGLTASRPHLPANLCDIIDYRYYLIAMGYGVIGNQP